MYVIGIDDCRLIKVIRFDTLYDGKNIWQDPRSVEYDALLDEATIFNDHEQAKRILDCIKSNAEHITFNNNNIVGNILDKDGGFDKLSYAKELKLFELVPVLTDDENH